MIMAEAREADLEAAGRDCAMCSIRSNDATSVEGLDLCASHPGKFKVFGSEDDYCTG
jgi:hypothetical protein